MNFKLDVYFHLGDNFIKLLTERIDKMATAIEEMQAVAQKMSDDIDIIVQMVTDMKSQLANVVPPEQVDIIFAPIEQKLSDLKPV
jgi:hypothetical protein